MKKPSQDYFDEVQGSYSYEDQHNTQEGIRNSIDEIPVNQLSGDEALEKSFMNTTGQSSIWQKKGGKTSIGLTSVVVMKSMVGVGILGIPYVASNFGVILTVVILLTNFVLGIVSSNLLLKSKNLSKRSNFSTIGFYIFKHKWIIIVVNIMIILSNLGVCLSELIVFGDTSSNLMNYFRDTDEQPFFLRRPMLIVYVSICLTPFLLVKTIEKLKFVSLFAILSISSFSCLVVYNFFKVDGASPSFTWGIPDNFEIKRALASMPTVILAYNWQFNLFPIYKGIEQATDKKLILSTIIGFILGTALYLIVGLLGFATYGTNIEPNYLLSIREESVGGVIYVILNLTFVLSTTLTLPVIFFGGRNNFIQLLKQFTEKKKVIVAASKQMLLQESDYKSQLEFRKRSQAIRFYAISIALFLLLTVGAIFISNLGTVYNLLGSVACNAIQLGLPALFYVFLVKQVKRMKFRNSFDKLFFFFVWVLLGLSVIFTVLCVTCEFIKPEKE